ncbi:MAG: hypothetical protein HOP19_25865, partial [Acidobacteria bacterium]|nr:hypothetical protein [Acidobacteriota bacterium]
MKADARFLRQNNSFWAHVRAISQHIGYTDRRTGRVKIPTADEIIECLNDLKLRTDHLFAKPTKPTALGKRLLAYFAYRADLLNQIVEPQLMDAAAAQAVFEKLQTELKPQCPLPMNKQKGEKKAPAYLTGIVNMLIESATADVSCDYDPRELVTVTADGIPRYTFARRFDGAFPQTVNPIAVWEIKEYYYTTTFGSRVADGVY